MKRPSIFNLMSHRQVINCPTALELCSLATEGTQEMKEIKEMKEIILADDSLD